MADGGAEWHPWHLKTLSGFHKTFGGAAYQSAKAKRVAGFDAVQFAQHLARLTANPQQLRPVYA